MPQPEVSEIPWLFPHNCKFPWPNELTNSEISLWWTQPPPSPTPHISPRCDWFMLSASHVECPWIGKKKCVLLTFHFILTSFKDLNFPLLKVKFSDSCLAWRIIFPNHFLTGSNHARGKDEPLLHARCWSRNNKFSFWPCNVLFLTKLVPWRCLGIHRSFLRFYWPISNYVDHTHGQ